MKELSESRLALGAGGLWQRATQSEFLEAVGMGTLPEDAFNRWLVQDYLFVKGFTNFLALVTSRVPRPEQSVLIAGMTALDGELAWFEEHARKRHLDLDVEAHPTCRRYVDFLIASAYSKPLEVLLAILFGVEVAYTVGWGQWKAEGRYAEFIDRWTNPEFKAYVTELMRIADAHPHPGQQVAFNEVMRHEHDFWLMTWEG